MLAKVYETIYHNSIRTYENIHSLSEEHGNGVIFSVKDKSDFKTNGVIGKFITNKEWLINQSEKISHVTFNMYRKFGYADERKTYLTGHSEDNLRQINVFAVDIDTKEFTVNEILTECVEQSIGSPTIITETPKGYQLIFCLDKPIYIKKDSDMALKMAKRVAANIKSSLQHIKVDQFCNDFGFFRLPKKSNIVWFNDTFIYTCKELIDFSLRRDNDNKILLFSNAKKISNSSVLETDWFHALVNANNVKGKKGQIGRNNLLFTVGLICYAEGKDIEYTYDLLDQINSSFNVSLSNKEVKTILNSAYSGKYKCANKEYVETLLNQYCNGQYTVRLQYKKWTKVAKSREERVRTHLHEWEQDLLNYINQKMEESLFIETTQSELCQQLDIASSSLNKLLNHSSKIIRKVIGKGKEAKTLLTTLVAFIRHTLEKLQLNKKAYAKYMHTIIPQVTTECGYEKELRVFDITLHKYG